MNNALIKQIGIAGTSKTILKKKSVNLFNPLYVFILSSSTLIKFTQLFNTIISDF